MQTRSFTLSHIDGPFLSVNCPLSVREMWPKGVDHEQRDCAKSLIINGWLWICLYLYGHEFPLITQRSQVQILPPQPFRESQPIGIGSESGALGARFRFGGMVIGWIFATGFPGLRGCSPGAGSPWGGGAEFPGGGDVGMTQEHLLRVEWRLAPLSRDR